MAHQRRQTDPDLIETQVSSVLLTFDIARPRILLQLEASRLPTNSVPPSTRASSNKRIQIQARRPLRRVHAVQLEAAADFRGVPIVTACDATHQDHSSINSKHRDRNAAENRNRLHRIRHRVDPSRVRCRRTPRNRKGVPTTVQRNDELASLPTHLARLRHPGRCPVRAARVQFGICVESHYRWPWRQKSGKCLPALPQKYLAFSRDSDVL